MAIKRLACAVFLAAMTLLLRAGAPIDMAQPLTPAARVEAVATTLPPTIAPTITPTETPTAPPSFAPEATDDAIVILVDEEPQDAITFAPTLLPTPTPTSSPSPSPSPRPGPTPTYEFENDEVRVEVVRHEIKNVTYFAAELWLSDVRQLLSAFSYDRYNASAEPVEDIAERNDAILAVNGDFATFNNGGIILRNGELFRANRSTRHLLVIDQNGDFIPMTDPPENSEDAAQGYLEQGVWQTLVFGPVLVENGEATELPDKFFISTGLALEPRTAIGQLGDLHYLILVVDGRKPGYSQGVSLSRLQELFVLHGVKTAFNLDGGGSTTLYFDGKVINRPANGGQRHVPDILYVKK